MGILHRGCRYQISVSIFRIFEGTNDILRIFVCCHADISFGVYCPQTANYGEELEVVPRTRVDSHILIEEGQIACSHLGTCMWKITLKYFRKINRLIFYTEI